MNWETDIKHMNEMCDNLTTEAKNHAFIICTGDMAEAGFLIDALISAVNWLTLKKSVI